MKLSNLFRFIFIFLITIFPSYCFGCTYPKPMDTQPRNIAKIDFINNDELLISEIDLYHNYRLWKYKISRNIFIPLINHDLSQNIACGFSHKGKTIFIYYKDSNIVEFRRNGISIFKRNLAEDIKTAMRQHIEGINDSLEIKHPFVTIIKVNNDSAAFINRSNGGLYLNLKLSPEYPNGYFLSPIFSYPINQVHDINNSILFHFYGYHPKNNEKDESMDLNEFNMQTGVYKKLFDLPEYYQIYRFCNLHGSVVKQCGNRIFLTVTNNHNRGKQTQTAYIHPSPELIYYDMDKKQIKVFKKDVRNYDISQNYLVTCNSVIGYLKSATDFPDVILYVYINVYNRKNRCIYSFHQTINKSFMIYNYLVPIITPDEKKIIVFRCFGNMKPLVIETSKLRK